MNTAFYEQQMAKCDISDFEFKVRDGTPIKVFVVRPKHLDASKKHPGYLYAHGGGAWSCRAHQFNNNMSHVALNLNCVVFNVDYRLSPEVKCPTGQQDFVDALFHVRDNADQYGVDINKLCISGASGGGYICTGAAVLLAKENKSHYVKACMVQTGMLSNQIDLVPESELNEMEMGCKAINTFTYEILSKDYKAEINDDQLMPGKASDAILAKLPPCAVFTSEFDILLRDNLVFAERLRKVGKLLALSNMPGVTHGYWVNNYDKDETKWFYEDEKKVFDTYVA